MYVLLKFDDGTYDILIKADNIVTYPHEYQVLITQTVLDGIVGEETRIRLISNIEIVESFDNEYKAHARSISQLSLVLQTGKTVSGKG
ncbi:MAG: hypothetical protein KGZ74_07135 [Chitinophagaceae bacterium]|nr:hypothetical protein [Chitinophagaceae bacterium]